MEVAEELCIITTTNKKDEELDIDAQDHLRWR